ncbi:hypothetical protein [uncultured Pontibacter sp.]|uniref:hypothetical protein n=1 Tax=uncultured Pontibacter sp. TaxID=453356 RepID=UPI0026309DE4|nr:hypothetical protein [uncultured Pontibacter sp.]
MPYLRFLLSCLTLVVSAPLLAQEPQQPVRLELTYDPETSYIEPMALPDSSLLVYIRKSDIWLRDPSYTLEKYNAQLELVWSAKLDLKAEYRLVRHYNEAPFTHLIFQAADLEQYTFVRIHTGNGKLAQSEIELEKAEFIHEFNVLRGKYFIIAGNRTDLKPNLLYLDPENPKPVILPSIYGIESSFSDLLTDDTQGRVDVVLTEGKGRISRLQVKSFDHRGKLLHNHFILQPDNRSLLNAEITPGDTLSRLLVGNYGMRDLRYSQGFFTAPVVSQIASGEFYSFLDLQNFFKYMKPRREERTRKREYARVAEGKEPSYRYRLLLHDLVVTPYGYVLAAEVYYPQYQSNTSYFERHIRGAGRNAQIYKRTHAVALGFDRDGILLWDNTFPIPDIVTSDLVHAIEIACLPDGRFVMAYPEREKIYYGLMEGNKPIEEDTYLELMPYEEDEKITSTDYPGLISWYGPHFAAFGYQRIRNPKGPNRTVYYITKISF